MDKKSYYIDVSNFSKLISKLMLVSTVIAPMKNRLRAYLEEVNADNAPEVDLFGFRSVESFKSIFFKITEKTSKYFGADEPTHRKKYSLVGIRGCDFEALEVTDRVFLEGEFKDPFYADSRLNDVLLIGADCTDCGKTCFCTMVKGLPYPVKLYDINLSPIKGGYLVDAGSEKGLALIKENPDLFVDARSPQREEKDRNRRDTVNLVDDANSKFFLRHEISDSHKANISNKVWKKLTKDCVECSACNFICPTCTCFLLLDQAKAEAKAKENERYKVWDACLKSGYQKVAGGANPRGSLYQRLQNRYHCKFDYSFDRLGRYTCVGCGRCIDACAGNIDMRKIFYELERQAPLAAELIE